MPDSESLGAKSVHVTLQVYVPDQYPLNYRALGLTYWWLEKPPVHRSLLKGSRLLASLARTLEPSSGGLVSTYHASALPTPLAAGLTKGYRLVEGLSRLLGRPITTSFPPAAKAYSLYCTRHSQGLSCSLVLFPSVPSGQTLSSLGVTGIFSCGKRRGLFFRHITRRGRSGKGQAVRLPMRYTTTSKSSGC